MLTPLKRSRGTTLRVARRGWARAWVLALFAVVTAGTMADTARAADARARFIPYSGDASLATTARPLSMDGAEPVKVVVRLQSESVAEVRARSATHAITADEERAVVATAHRDHVAIHPAIQGLGGRVVAEYHHALNGVAVMIPRGQVASLATLPGVRSVHRVNTYTISNATGVPYLDTPAVWQGHPALKGEGIKIAIIDTGIDYTHADFGGPGTPAAFAAAAAASTVPADPTLFGPNAPKVKGGIDLVGDAYDANNPNSVPVPDANPLDCNGHGTHVAGTAAGFGVASGATYAGPYSVGAYATTHFDVGPGVAPQADLYAVRIFGCSGATNLATEAIDWAVQNHMDVINLSLGSAFGTGDTADAIAADNAAKAGITVVAAAGNKGAAPYIADTPGTSTHVISAAAMDAHQVYPNGVRITLTSGTINGVETNTLALPSSPPLVVLKTPAGLALGCPDSNNNYPDYPQHLVGNPLVIVSRGSCTFDLKAAGAAAAGAGAIGVVNNAAGYINASIQGVTIPFIELLQSDTTTLLHAGPTATLVAAIVPNPTFETIASFSSGGPRFGDSFFKPNVSAPGVGVLSAGSGSGNGAANESGTSMATPHVAGVAALTREAHPRWREDAIEAAIVETANPGMLVASDPRLAGAGVVQPLGATATQVVAFDDDGNASLSFGFEESTRDYSASRQLTIRNYGRDHVRFNVSYSPASTSTGVPHTVTLSRTSLSVDGNNDAELQVTLQVPVATIGASHDAPAHAVYRDVAGYIVLTPAGHSNAPALTIPYYLTPRARSRLSADLAGSLSPRHPNAGLRLSNRGGAITATADFYAWGLASPPQGDPYFDTRAVGVASNLVANGADSILVFAVNTWTRFSNAAAGEWDILIDVNGDGQPDYVLYSTDLGSSTGGTPNGTVVVALYDIAAKTTTPVFFADAPTDGSTVLMPVYASQLGLTPTRPTFSYAVQYFDRNNGAGYAMPGQARFNAFSPSITNAAYYTVPPGVSGTVPVAIDPVQWQTSPALGLMIVSEDNTSGPGQAQLLRANH